MDPRRIPFNALIVEPTNSGKTQYLLNQLRGTFRSKFDYILLICPTFVLTKLTSTSWTTSHAFTLSTVSNTRWKPTSSLLVSILRRLTRPSFLTTAPLRKT